MIYSINDIELAVEYILNGKIIIIPTDTLYGFSFDAYNSKTTEKFNKFKKRHSPLSIIVDSIKMAKKYAKIKGINKIQHLLPGPFTFLFSKSESGLAPLVTNNSNKIGIRIPDNKFCIEIVKRFKRPIVTTSVNSHGAPPLIKIKIIKESFSNFHIFEGVENINSKGSTIVDMTQSPYAIIRHGDGEFHV